jgi:hypothetical protein
MNMYLLGVGRIRMISCICIIIKFYEGQILQAAIAVDFLVMNLYEYFKRLF